MNLEEFFEENVSMKVSHKYSRIGEHARCSREYLKMLAKLVYNGYDVYDQITYEAYNKTRGIGFVKFAAVIKDTVKFFELRFKYSYTSRLRGLSTDIIIVWGQQPEQENNEIATIMETDTDEETTDTSSDDTEPDKDKALQL